MSIPIVDLILLVSFLQSSTLQKRWRAFGLGASLRLSYSPGLPAYHLTSYVQWDLDRTISGKDLEE
jgi:hypothetical protein